MSTPGCVAVIPARYASTRFPGKPLALLAGRPMIAHVVDRVLEAALFDAVWVATDDERIAAAARTAGAEPRLTRTDHATGTERVGEACAGLPPGVIVLNVQGDEPLVAPALLREMVEALRADPALDWVTAAHPSEDAAAFRSPHVVKAVVDARGDALYFSRAPVPYARDGTVHFLHHVGLYGYRHAALQRFIGLAPGVLEQSEGLEQLRALENGLRIRVLRTAHATLGVDTPEDLKAVASRLGGA